MKKRALSTLEWIIIAAVVLVMIAYALGYWKGIWGTATAAAERANWTFAESIEHIFK
jgi:hypothetical protein